MKQTRPHNNHSRRLTPAKAQRPVKRRASKVTQRAALRRHIRSLRPLHKRLVLHPISILMLLVAGVLIIGWTVHSAAASYSVTAKIPADPLTEGAVITSPTDGAIFTTVPVTVSGTCPDNSYVTLTRNGAFSGVAACQADNTFSIQTSLASGSNLIVAQDFNITDDPGPTTDGITVVYNPPAPPVSSGGSSSPSSIAGSTPASPQPLLISTDFQFHTFTVGSVFNWRLTIQGGIAPYRSHIDWGDHKTSDLTFPHAVTVTISHTYLAAGYFPITVQMSDSTGARSLIQLVAFIKSANGTSSLFQSGLGTPAGGANEDALSSLIGSSKWLLFAWPTYIIVTLMAFSFWLGERQIYHQLLAAQVGTRSAHARSRR